MKPHKKPKYKLDAKQFEVQHEQKQKQEKDWEESDAFSEVLKSKLRFRHR